MEAIVEYDYDASEPDKLTLRKDDVVRDIVKKYNGWWEGTLRNKRGLFPAHLVQVTTRRKARHQCRALFSYEAEHNDELSLSVGDVIDVICEVEEGWWKGRLNGVEGVFPSNFVTTIELDRSSSKEELNNRTAETDSNLPNLPPKPTRITCRVKYPYDACNDDELTLREGDIITLLSKDGQDSGWWKGELNGRIGVFPDNFVVVLPNTEPPSTNNATSGTGAVPSTSTTTKTDKKTDKSLSKAGAMSVDEPSVASQRRTIELKGDEHKMPPVPGKKPSLPKKTTAAANMKQRITHVVDGAAPSRPKEPADTDFDQVERSGMLSDMRATRARGPGRRPPSAVYRDAEAGLVNGNSDHVQAAEVGAPDDADDNDKKRKVHEWQKHKAPWVEELKMNQARRTPPPAFASFSVSTAPTQNNDIARIRLTPPYESISPMETVKSPKPDNPPNIPSESCKTRPASTDQQEVKTIRTKVPEPTTSTSTSTGCSPTTSASTSPLPVSSKVMEQQQQDNKERPNTTMTHGEVIECVMALRERLHRLEVLAGIKTPETSNDQVSELAERVARMEVQVTRLHTTVEELRTKLKVESDLRRMLQAKLDKVEQCVTQV